MTTSAPTRPSPGPLALAAAGFLFVLLAGWGLFRAVVPGEPPPGPVQQLASLWLATAGQSAGWEPPAQLGAALVSMDAVPGRTVPNLRPRLIDVLGFRKVTLEGRPAVLVQLDWTGEGRFAIASLSGPLEEASSLPLTDVQVGRFRRLTFVQRVGDGPELHGLLIPQGRRLVLLMTTLPMQRLFELAESIPSGV